MIIPIIKHDSLSSLLKEQILLCHYHLDLSTVGPGNNAQLRLNADLSALSLRATEYLQRWKEVVQFSSKDYSDQMAAQFGIKAPESMGNHAHYIGGWSNVININEVVNTNLDTDTYRPPIVTGKQIGRAHV